MGLKIGTTRYNPYECVFCHNVEDNGWIQATLYNLIKFAKQHGIKFDDNNKKKYDVCFCCLKKIISPKTNSESNNN